MKNKICLLAILLLSSLAVFAQAPDWAWAKSVGSTGDENGQSTAADALGNVYVTGYYTSSTITFGSSTLINTGIASIFIVKYDALGNVLWAKGVGSTGDDRGTGITTDLSGNVYVTGIFGSHTIIFDGLPLNNIDGWDIFIAKYNAAGNLLWVRSAGDGGYDVVLSPSVDAFGNVYLTGAYEYSISFGAYTLVNTNSPNNIEDMFIVKYDSLGNVLWAKDAGSSVGADDGRSITNDAAGNVYVTGYYASPYITFGSVILYNADSTGNKPDIFIVKYDPTGNVLWAKREGGIGADYGNSIATDASGNIFVTGYYSSPSITFGNTTLTNVDTTDTYPDIFIVKYDSLGNMLWAKDAGGVGYDFSYDCTTDTSGNVYVIGYYSSTSITFGATTLTNAGGFDIFIVKYDTDGNALWAKGAGSSYSERGYSASADASGNVYITGIHNSSIDFGTTTLTNAGNSDMFIAKINAIPTGIAENDMGNSTIIAPNPFNFFTTIQLNASINNGQLNIYNLYGQLVKEIKNISGKLFTLSRDNLPSGLYFSQLIEGSKVIATNKVIIID